MRKSFLKILGSVALTGLIVLTAPKGGEDWDPIPDSHKEYAELFNAKLAELPGSEDLESMDKFNRPDMFAAFDKLKRMDPATGEVPAKGYVKAYRYIQQEWGDPAQLNTGYALDWEERGPSGVGGRTRAVMWDPNDPAGKALFAGGVGGGMWYTADVTTVNATWTNVSPTFSNVAVTCIAHDPSNTQIMYYGTGEGWFNADALRGAGVWKSTDGGMNWDVLPVTETGDFLYVQKILVDTNGDVYIGSKGGLFRSEDGGQTVEKVLGSGTGTGVDWMTDLEIAGNGDLYAAGSSGGIYKSPESLGSTQGDAGSWTKLTINFPGGFDRIEMAVGTNNSDYIYAVAEVNDGTSAVFRSTNGGSNWSQTPNQPNGGSDYSNGQAWYDLCLSVDPNNHLTVYTGAIDQYRTTNGGQSWTTLTSAYGGPNPYIHPDQHNIVVNPMNSNQVVFANDGGIWYSNNRGTNPAERNVSYNVTQFYSLAINPKRGSNVIIGGTQDNGSIMVNAPGIGMGIGLTGSDGGYSAINQINPDTMFTTTQWSTVRRSRNGGATFNNISNPALGSNNTLFINPLELDPVNPNNLYQASTALWYHSNANTGGSGGWRQVTANLGGQITAIAVPHTNDLVYFAANGTVYRLDNIFFAGSTTVPDQVPPPGGGYLNCILIDPNDENHIFVTYSSFGVVQRVVETHDADQGTNATWKNLTGNLPDLPTNWATFEPGNPNGLLVGTDMGVFRCADYTVDEADIYWSPESRGMGYPRVEQIKTRYADSTVILSTHGRGFFSTNSYTQAPVADFGYSGTLLCGGEIQFFDSTSNAPTSWQWDFGDGNTSTNQSPVHTYASSGTYTVTLISGNGLGNDTHSSQVTVTVLPPVVAIAGPDQSGCPGDTVWLSASGGVSYSWFPTFGLNDAYIADPYYVLSGTRDYVVTVTDSNGCIGTDTVTITQEAAPSVWAGQDMTITAPNDSAQMGAQGADFYDWTPTTGLSCTNCPDPKAYPASTTTYTVTGTNAAGCSRSDQVTVTVAIVGVEEEMMGTAVLHSVSPNPVHDHTVLDLELRSGTEMRITIFDLKGQLIETVFEGRKAAGAHRLEWRRPSNIEAGVYFLKMEAAGQTLVSKLLLL